jgi:hypothetical protein
LRDPEDNCVVDHDHEDRHTAKKIQLYVPLATSDLDVLSIVQDSSESTALSLWDFEPEFPLCLGDV